MKKSILNISFSKLLKHEVQNLASSVIGIVQKHDPETLKIKEIFDILVEQEPQIIDLQSGYGPHPVTLRLNKLRKHRDAFTQGLIDQIKAKENTEVDGTQEALAVAKPIIVRLLKSLPKNKEKKIKQTLFDFFNLLEVDEQLGTAFETLELNADINKLRNVSREIDKQYNLRRESVSARPKAKTPQLIAALKSDMQDLFKQIEVAQIKNKDLDYNPLIDELNNEIGRAKVDINVRASYNKKQAEAVLDDNEVVEKDNDVAIEDESGEPSESTQTIQRMYPLSEEVANENPGPLDIKKTVAVSAKQTRLPDVSTEA